MKMLVNGFHQQQGKPKILKGKFFLALTLGLAFSQSFAQFEISKYTINSGGAKMSGGIYEVSASIGQTDASTTQIGGTFSLNGGFWHENTDLIFKNGFE